MHESDGGRPESATAGDARPARALTRLFHHRWALPALAQVAAQRGAKFVTLSRQLGVGPASLKRALLRLSELDLVVRNPGYGHPMRPEYVLGELGQVVATPADALWRWLRRTKTERELLKKWHLSTLLVLGPAVRRFRDVQAALPESSPRALALALRGLTELGLIERRVDAGYPPTPTYAPTRRARTARRHLEAIGRPLAKALFD
ncbi:MAG: winged helix-turn-helix transcriptional regulator [Planctomycetota bacterium]|nr:winged helix-turn-helix transcriptional regulator [Planctomycetota bacterium]